MWWAGLDHVYRFFFGYLFVDLLQTTIPFWAPFDSASYRYAWLVTESLLICFYVLVVLELYAMVLQNLSGMASLSRRYIQAALGIAVLASLLLLMAEKMRGGMVAHLFVFERAVVFSLMLFVLLLTAFLVYYPIPLKRNVIVYSAGYAVYFLAKATSIFVYDLGYYWNKILDNTWLPASLACMLFWLFALNRSGETRTVIIGHHWNPEDEQRLLTQLSAINTSLLRTARK